MMTTQEHFAVIESHVSVSSRGVVWVPVAVVSFGCPLLLGLGDCWCCLWLLGPTGGLSVSVASVVEWLSAPERVCFCGLILS